MIKLTDKKIKWAINQVVKHKKNTKSVARLLDVETGEYPQLNPNKRPKTYLTEEEKDFSL